MLKAGIDGIKNKITPPASVDLNIYDMTAAQREEIGIGSLPGSLIESLDELKKDEVVMAALGDHIAKRFIEAKELEYENIGCKYINGK